MVCTCVVLRGVVRCCAVLCGAVRCGAVPVHLSVWVWLWVWACGMVWAGVG